MVRVRKGPVTVWTDWHASCNRHSSR